MLKTIGDCPPTVPVAIVPIKKGQWSAVISSKLRREYPDCVPPDPGRRATASRALCAGWQLIARTRMNVRE
jgi:hypothetical protein